MGKSMDKSKKEQMICAVLSATGEDNRKVRSRQSKILIAREIHVTHLSPN